ncbi:hypothetical protein Vadar_026267 [Vaccinium darrowii]|uniref:Uncharacterized protein n=1 Tax=Vaccinium darrowii TaxID=229202 RepID=A0ACB7Y1Q0_9ERIC|nr:hypothetical protein Vadar_026267 [Vaccinium darrowii]
MVHNRKRFKWIFNSDNGVAYTGSKIIFLQLFSSSPSSSSCLKVQFAYTTTYDDVADPRAVVSPPIPPCDVKLSCFDFFWSGNDSSRIASIVSSILANNPGRIIPSEKLQNSFKDCQLEDMATPGKKEEERT